MKKKHCFGEYLLDNDGDTTFWASSYFGPFLSGDSTPQRDLYFFEQLYMDKLAAGSNTYNCPNCNEYNGASPDSTGNQLWTKKVLNKNIVNSYITSNAVLSNGTIVISGFPWNNPSGPPTAHAFLYCFNNIGDSLWYKEFSPTDSSLKTEFYDVIATTDGGLLACGQLMDSNGVRKSYFIKLDENGNLFNPLSVLEKKNETYLHVYPNPAISFVSIHYLGVNKNVSLSITNLQGKVIYKE